MQTTSDQRWWLKGITVGALLCLGASASFAQNADHLARRDRSQRKAIGSLHVYTNADLARREILTPQDRARFAAAREDQKHANAVENAAMPALPNKQTPLGTLARRLRAAEQRSAERASSIPANNLQPAAGENKIAEPRRSALVLSRKRATLQSLTSLATAGEFRVRAGDTLWSIARRRLGKGELWREIAEANPALINPNLIHPGEWLHLPAVVLAKRSHEGLRVRAGDSLWKLAATRFGSGDCWTSIARANPGLQNPNFIYPGENLNLPQSCSSGRTTVSMLRRP